MKIRFVPCRADVRYSGPVRFLFAKTTPLAARWISPYIGEDMPNSRRSSWDGDFVP